VPSRQDQLHSYQYSLQRVVAALVTHDPDPSRSPLRRAGTTALVSLLIAAIAVGAAGLYGIFTGQNSVDPTDPNVVFEEKGTGARFVFLDGKLHPVLNYSSGLLLSGGDSPDLESVAADKLAKVPLGAALGIPGAPDSLPGRGDLLTGRWSVCTDNQGANGSSESTLLVGDKLTDGAVIANQALIVADPDGTVFVVFGNRRFQVPTAVASNTLRALKWGDQTPWPVSAAWINAVPAGPDLRAPRIPGQGGQSDVSDLPIGTVVTNGGSFGVILVDGLADVTPMQAILLQVAQRSGGPRDIGGDFIKLRPSRVRLSDANDPNGLPPTIPDLFTARPTRVCMTLPIDPKTGDGVRVDPTVPAGVAVAGAPVAPQTPQVDRVHVTRGKGAVVVGEASATAPAGSGTVGIVTDTGRLFTLAKPDLLGKLGYGGVKPQEVPAQLFSLVPRGPSLDPAQASTPQN
jgi:type VII secretion protein EccB